MKPFRERNPVPIGAVGTVIIAALLIGAFRAGDLPLIGGGDTYYAEFAESAGLAADDEVRLAGVRIGKVDDVELDDGRVKVTIKVKTDSNFGETTGASIRIKTLLGSKFLALEPAGTGQLAEGETIPVERTVSPFDVTQAFEGLAETASEVDTDQLAKSLTTLSDLTRDTSEEFRAALSGVSALSQNIAAKDEEINSLLTNLERFSTVLDDRDDDIIALMQDSDVLFRALVARRDEVHRILLATSKLSRELTTLVRSTRQDLAPALRQLETTVGILNKNENNIDNSLRLMAPFYRVFASTLGNGPWFDTFIFNLPPVPDLSNGVPLG